MRGKSDNDIFTDAVNLRVYICIYVHICVYIYIHIYIIKEIYNFLMDLPGHVPVRFH